MRSGRIDDAHGFTAMPLTAGQCSGHAAIEVLDRRVKDGARRIEVVRA